MKILHNAVLALLLIGSLTTIRAEEIDVMNALANALTVLENDTYLYARLQNELNEITKQFDMSAEMRRHLHCCVSYKFDALNEDAATRESELQAIIAAKDSQIADLNEEYESFKARAATEIEALSTMVEVLTLELDTYRTIREMDLDASVDELFELIAQVQDQYAAMQEQRLNFLAKLEDTADRAYGHFEVEAIESTVFGEQICGTLYCPELDNQSVEADESVATSDEQPADEPTVGDAGSDTAFEAYVSHWDATVPE